MIDALSTPPYANAMVDQKMTSLKLVLGMNARAFIGVADPCRTHERRPSAISSSAGTQPASAPALCSHFPTFNPTMLSVTASVRPIIATVMKYVLFDDSD